MAFLRSRPWLVLAGLFALGLCAGACFNPNQPACGFSCAEAGACPEGYSCVCHKIGATGMCPLDDAGTSD